MATASSPGIGSGLDVNSLVPALVNAVISPLQTAHDNSLSIANTTISNIGKIKSSLSSLQDALTNLSSISNMYSLTTNLSDTGYFTASMSSTNINAAKGSYQVEVQKLAQAQSLATGYVADPNNVGTGSVVINFGSYDSNNVFTPNSGYTNPAVNINITGSNSLADIRDAINSASSDVTANIVTDSKGSRLTLTSNKTGEEYAMQISGSLSALNYDPASPTSALSQTVAAQNSLVAINGLVVSNNTNQLNDTISGVNINLQQAQPGKIITLNVDNDTKKVSDAINSFITQYNTTASLINGLTNYDSANKKAAPLQFDPQVRALKQSLASILNTTNNDPSNPIRGLGDLGISLDNNGLLQLNQDSFSNALANNYQNISGLFIQSGTSAGIATQMGNLIDDYNLAGIGQFAKRQTILDQQLQILGDQQDRISNQKKMLTNKYMAQFSALDTLLGKLKSTSDYLTAQANKSSNG